MFLLFYLWGTDPERPRFNPQSRSFSFTTHQGLMAVVLGSHRGKAGSAVQLGWPEVDLMTQPLKAGLLMKGSWRRAMQLLLAELLDDVAFRSKQWQFPLVPLMMAIQAAIKDEV